MNASVQDVDNNGWLDIYVSNVHHALQAEGSLMWMIEPSHDPRRPRFVNRAAELGVLNEQRFGWGAALADVDNDGRIDIVQANGMVDDTIDRRYDTCPDYWYVNEKIARSSPSIHRYADRWGDIRGMCIYGRERNRVYLNRGTGLGARFIDVADRVGLTEETNSRGVAAVDLDDDGRLDLVITHQFAPPSIYRNVKMKSDAKAHWIGLELEGDGVHCSRDAAGVSVRLEVVHADGSRSARLREVQVLDGFAAQNDRRLHFGLGDTPKSVSAIITGCGDPRRLDGLKIDRYQAVRLP
jgi:hypothetical protein